MKIRFASALLALSLPLFAQDPAASETEAIFYKAFYLEKGQKDFAGAMALYEQFLGKAPEHKLAAEAAKQQFGLLDRTGKTKERDAFKAKYEKLLGNVAVAGGAADAAGGDAPRGAGPGGPGRGEGRGDPAARMAELEKQLAKAKEAGNEEEVKKLTAQLERAKQMGERGARGQGGQARGGLMAVMRNNKKVSEMTDEELTQLKDALGQSSGMIERIREGGNEEMADKLSTGVESLKKALEASNKDDAQKALDAIRAAMPARRGRGEGAGGGGPGGGNAGGSAGGGGGGGR